MTNEVIYFIPPFLGVVLVGFGMSYKEYIIGVLGGLLIFLYGVAIFLVPIAGVSSLMNDIIGSICFGLGLYVFLAANTDELEQLLPL